MTPVRRMFSSLRPQTSDTVRREYEGRIKDLWRRRQDVEVRDQLRYTLYEYRLLAAPNENGDANESDDKTG